MKKNILFIFSFIALMAINITFTNSVDDSKADIQMSVSKTANAAAPGTSYLCNNTHNYTWTPGSSMYSCVSSVAGAPCTFLADMSPIGGQQGVCSNGKIVKMLWGA